MSDFDRLDSDLSDITSDDGAVAEAIIDRLRSLSAHDDRMVATLDFPPRNGHRVDWPAWAHPAVIDHYRAAGVPAPWAHQALAADAITQGAHTVVATGTGSGKSLAAWLPILSSIAAHDTSAKLSDYRRRPAALYLAPTKALAADQLTSLTRLLTTPADDLGVRVGVADGDTPSEVKAWARAQADVVLTNPDYLHHVMLPGCRSWTRLLSHLAVIVVDEMHYWRGVAGGHVALVLRRLLRIARRFGADPTVVFLSATVSQPAVSASRLIGVTPEEIVAVTDDTSPSGARTLVLWQPGWMVGEDIDDEEYLRVLAATADAADDNHPQPVVLTTGLRRRSSTSEAAMLTATAVDEGARVLTFVRSRYGAESVTEQARDHLRRRGSSGDTVAAYRGGYLPQERRELEQSLRHGDTRALVTTNALELGIDISGLDATITAGWPGTRASLWQQVGRAGRAGRTGISILVASDNPMDTYLVHHPHMITAEVEASTFDPANPYIVTPHVLAAAAEAPLTAEDVAVFGLSDTGFFEALESQGYLRRRPDGWYWNTTVDVDAHQLTNIRGEGGEVQIVEETTGRVVGTVNSDQAHSHVHPGAIYIHQGVTYQVTQLTHPPVIDGMEATRVHSGGAEVALVHPVVTRLRTRPTVTTRVHILAEREAWEDPTTGVRWCWGDVEVESRVTDFDTLRLPGLEWVSNTKLDLPARRLTTASVWWTLPLRMVRDLNLTDDELPGALHAAEHASIGMLPLLATCDRWDLGGLSTALHDDTELPTVFVHDAYPGGAGFAEYGWRHAAQWLTLTREAIASCGCEDGCPSCIQSPKCGNHNEPLSKTGALSVLGLLLSCPPHSAAPAGSS